MKNGRKLTPGMLVSKNGNAGASGTGAVLCICSSSPVEFT